MRSGRGILAALLMAATGLTGASAHATLWQLDSIEHGTDGGFGFSSFHDASDETPMTGSVLATVTGGSGFFNDSTGEFDLDLTLDSGTGDTAELSGTLGFSGFGFLGATSTVSVDGTAAFLSEVTDMTFLSGDLCCSGGSDDPNSFIGTTPGTAVMSLWGADGYVSGEGYVNNSVGTDLRLTMVAVPAPGTLALLGLATLGLLAFARGIPRRPA